jgi:hypothetical protein
MQKIHASRRTACKPILEFWEIRFGTKFGNSKKNESVPVSEHFPSPIALHVALRWLVTGLCHEKIPTVLTLIAPVDRDTLLFG